MTTVGTTGPAPIQSWMVPKLFGTPAADQNGVPVKDPFATDTSSTAVSGLTSEAIAKLKQGGALPEQQSAAVSNAIVKRLNAMTSDEITDAMYSGQGLAFAGGLTDSPNTTFASIMKGYTDSVATLRKWAADDQHFSYQRQNSAGEADRLEGLVDTLQKAFDEKTLVFHRASEIKGLDFRENIEFNNDLRAPMKGSDQYNINTSFLMDHHLEDHVLPIPGITLFMSW